MKELKSKVLQVYKAPLSVDNSKKIVNFFSIIKNNIKNVKRIWIAVAFITIDQLKEIWSLFEKHKKSIEEIKILTSIYNHFNDPKVFEFLENKQQYNKFLFKCKVWDPQGKKHKPQFHPKLYMFFKEKENSVLIGSSNLTEKGFKKNIEMNVLLEFDSYSEHFNAIKSWFDEVWENDCAKDISKDWIKNYTSDFDKFKEKRMEIKALEEKIIKETKENIIGGNTLKVRKSQERALWTLILDYINGRRRGILALATAVGKTHTAAFFCKLFAFKRILFITPNVEIARNAKKIFLEVFQKRLSWNNDIIQKVEGISKTLNEVARENEDEFQVLSGNGKNKVSSKCAKLFAVYNSAKKHLKKQMENFDIIIVDEAHHTMAKDLYIEINRWIEWYKPKFILGLTATDFRTSRDETQQLMDFYSLGNKDDQEYLIDRVSIMNGIENGDLCKFHYYSIQIGEVYGKVEDNEGSSMYIIDYKILKEEIRKVITIETKIKALVFCKTTKHAKRVCNKLNNNKTKKIAILITGNSKKTDRKNVFKWINDENNPLEFIVSVNVYNEGVDIPALNTIIFLRPTNSPIIYIQQLGRGLRKQDNKELVIFDFVRSDLDLIENLENIIEDRDLKIFSKDRVKRIRGEFKKRGCVLEIGSMHKKKITIDDTLDRLTIRSQFKYQISNAAIAEWKKRCLFSRPKKEPTLKLFNESFPFPQSFLMLNGNNDNKHELNGLYKLWKYIEDSQPFRFPSNMIILKYIIENNFKKCTYEEIKNSNSSYKGFLLKKHLKDFATFINCDLCRFKPNELHFYVENKNNENFMKLIRDTYDYYDSIYNNSYKSKKDLKLENRFIYAKLYRIQDMNFLLKTKIPFNMESIEGIYSFKNTKVLLIDIDKSSNRIIKDDQIQIGETTRSLGTTIDELNKLRDNKFPLNLFIKANFVNPGLNEMFFYLGVCSFSKTSFIKDSYVISLNTPIRPYLKSLFQEFDKILV